MNNTHVVNVVGTGEIPAQINYQKIIDEIDVPVIQYDPSIHQGLELRFVEEGPLITVYTTGKYIIRAENVSVVEETRESFLKAFEEIGIIDSQSDEKFNINNLVATGDIGQELDLETLSGDLSNGKVDYDPEIFPGIRYEPYEFPCTVLIFRSGKVVITAATNKEVADKTFESLRREIEYLIESEEQTS